MGNLLFESGHARHALKYHQQALKFNPKELHAIVGIANALYDLEEPQSSIKYYQQAVEINEP